MAAISSVTIRAFPSILRQVVQREAQLDRSEIKATIRRAYQMRLANDPEGCMACVVPDVRYCIAGSPEHSPVAVRCEGQEAFRETLAALVETWRWKQIDFKRLLIDGGEAMVEYTLTLEHAPSGRRVTTDIVDTMTFSDGKIAVLTEYVDTALATALFDAAAKG